MSNHVTRVIFIIGMYFYCIPNLVAGQIEFVENKGQWHENVLYRAGLSTGAVFLEKDGFTYSLLDLDVIHHAHHHQTAISGDLQGHAFKMTFVNTSLHTSSAGKNKRPNYRNYFLGNNPDKWKSNVQGFEEVQHTKLYNGINMRTYSNNGHLKYDLIVAANVDAALIQMKYDGLDNIRIRPNGDLELKTTLMDVLERKPIAYQTINDEQIEVACEFVLNGNVASFHFPNGYDQNHELTIDPELVFSTYSGSDANNFGSSATYDSEGHLYGAGTSFGLGYPTTTGAYTQTAAGVTDIGFSKFSTDGSSLIYSTFVGGSASESVNSTIVNINDELYLFGTTGSTNYPVSANAFQANQNGGTSASLLNGYSIEFLSGCDIVISKFSADGTSLLASTYVGGSGNDGINFESLLDYNYGDPFRGEINVDNADNVYVASCTESSDFPVSANAAQPVIGGGRDGLIFKMNSDLSNMTWATFVGGSSVDNAYAIQLNSNGEIVAAGGTLSNDFPTTANALNTNYGGLGDGWVMRLSTNGSQFLSSSYIGTNKYDQVYFVQFDPNDEVLILGQSAGTIPITPSSVYSNPNSGQFIQKLTNDLSTLSVSTTFGTGNGGIDISPTAFLVSNCGQIFVSGWGGATNSNYGNALESTTNGLPISADAFQPSTDGSDFYLMVLEADAEGLVYATYFGGGVSTEHVDGGTSRFDKNGIVYQAVCAGCGGNDDFPSTPGAWSSTNESSCNLGVFKFDLNRLISAPDFNINLENCDYPLDVEFINNSTGANTYYWDFGDNETSTYFEGSHFYDEPGSYEITLIARDSANCLTPDTASIEFEIPEPPLIFAFGSDTICALDTVPIWVEGEGIASYDWSPAFSLENADTAQVNALPAETTVYIVTATDSVGCQVTDSVVVYVSGAPTTNAGDDAYLQIGVPGYLYAETSPNSTILWSPPEGLSCTTCPDPIADPQETTTYYIEVTDEFGCTISDSVIVYAYPTIYVPNAFTPGGNVINPIFYVYGLGISFFELNIYTRWGQHIYHSNEQTEGWDGNTNGLEAQQGVYVWTLKYSTDVNPNIFEQEIGHVTLLRNHY